MDFTSFFKAIIIFLKFFFVTIVMIFTGKSLDDSSEFVYKHLEELVASSVGTSVMLSQVPGGFLVIDESSVLMLVLSIVKAVFTAMISLVLSFFVTRYLKKKYKD